MFQRHFHLSYGDLQHLEVLSLCRLFITVNICLSQTISFLVLLLINLLMHFLNLFSISFQNILDTYCLDKSFLASSILSNYLVFLSLPDNMLAMVSSQSYLVFFFFFFFDTSLIDRDNFHCWHLQNVLCTLLEYFLSCFMQLMFYIMIIISSFRPACF